MKRDKKVIALGVSLLLAASSLGCSPANIADDIKDIPEPDEPLNQLPKLMDNKEFLSLVQKLNPKLDHETTIKIANAIEKYCQKYNVPENLVVSVIAVESGFTPNLKGSLDDTGLMQIRFKYAPYWAKLMELTPPNNMEELSDVDTNIHMGTYILKSLLDRYDGNLEQALVAYNSGQTYVDRKLRNDLSLPKNYVKKVSRYHLELCNIPVSAVNY